jgi:hypothetical protein
MNTFTGFSISKNKFCWQFPPVTCDYWTHLTFFWRGGVNLGTCTDQADALLLKLCSQSFYALVIFLDRSHYLALCWTQTAILLSTPPAQLWFEVHATTPGLFVDIRSHQLFARAGLKPQIFWISASQMAGITGMHWLGGTFWVELRFT